ncbi:MAG: response regulator transcription factor [Chloroflexi bacterium]|nr:response regulator transcription factor [Chloroflexota bacterium]
MRNNSSIDNEILTSAGGVDLDNLDPIERPRILIVDDEQSTVSILKHILINDGFNVASSLSGIDALRKITEINPSLIILDLLMPEMDGSQILDEIRKISNIPVIMLSAVNQKEEIVRLLKKGADDYITKPFNSAEVTARIEAVLRRTEKPKVLNKISFPGVRLIVDLETYEVIFKGIHIQLTGKLFEVLAILAKSAPRVVNYQDLTMQIWGENTVPVRNRLKYLIYLLRQEFEKIDEKSDLIDNVDRLGYKLIIEQ